jgi:glycosyltransferase involved in cell wall biosynthesis
MKILAISHAPNDENAGASRIYHLLAGALREKGHTVNVLHYDDLKMPRGALGYFIKRMALPAFIGWRFYPEALKGYDVIFSSNGMAYPIYRKLQKLPARPRLINHVHGAAYLDYEATFTEWLRGHTAYSLPFVAFKGRFADKWELRGARYSDVVVTQCLRDVDYLNDRRELRNADAGFQAEIVRIPAAVHPRIAAAGRSAVPMEQRDPDALLWFGSWGDRKGIHYLNRAFRQIKKSRPRATLTLGGTGQSPADLAVWFDADLRGSLRVLPRISIDEQIAEFNRHSIFLFPSLSEGFGLALVEAMSMGLACVTTFTGLVGDWMTDEREAMIVPMASAAHIAIAAVKLMENDGLRRSVGAAGQTLAATFTVERFVREYLAVFETAASAKAAAN